MHKTQNHSRIENIKFLDTELKNPDRSDRDFSYSDFASGSFFADVEAFFGVEVVFFTGGFLVVVLVSALVEAFEGGFLVQVFATVFLSFF